MLVIVERAPLTRAAELSQAGVRFCAPQDEAIIAGFQPDWLHVTTYDRHGEWVAWARRRCRNVALIYHHVPAFSWRGLIGSCKHPARVLSYVRTAWGFQKKLRLFFGCGETVAEGIRRAYPLFPSQRVVALRNSILLPPKNRQTTLVGAARFIQVGGLNERKRPRIALAAFQRVVREFPQATLTFVGDGEQRRELEAVVARHQIINVMFTGEISGADAFWLDHNIAVLPSAREGLPYVLLEAAGRGLPLIATNVDGNVEICIDGATGFTVGLDDVDALEQRMRLLAGDAELRCRLGDAARARVGELFSLDQAIAKLEQLYGHFQR